MIFTVLCAVVTLVILFIFAELAAAVLPILIVLALVPPEERRGLAELIAAADSSTRLRLWSALRVAVRARRQERAQR
jgi:putative exporter of polyketide antibiotics